MLLLWPVLFILIIVGICISSFVIFLETHISQHERPFAIYKLRNMKNGKLTRTGQLLRQTILDEVLKLFNIANRDTIFTGELPDAPDYYDQLLRV